MRRHPKSLRDTVVRWRRVTSRRPRRSPEEAFREFFDNQAEIPEVMQKAGAKGKPQVTFYRKLDTPDEY